MGTGDNDLVRSWGDDLANPDIQPDPTSGTYRTEFDSVSRSVSEAVITAVATANRRDPEHLPPLYRSIDPDALDSIFSPTLTGRVRFDGLVTFNYAEHAITVNSHGTVEVAPIGRHRSRDEFD